MKIIKNVSALLIVFAIALSLIVGGETNVSAKTGHNIEISISQLTKLKSKKTKYKNGKIKTRTTYYKDKQDSVYVTIYRKYNKSGKEYYAKTTQVIPKYLTLGRRKTITVFSNYKKNGKTLGYTKVKSMVYLMKKKNGKWIYKKDSYSQQNTTSKGRFIKTSWIRYNSKGQIGVKAEKGSDNFYSNGNRKNSTIYYFYKNKFVKSFYATYDTNENLIMDLTYDINGNYKEKTEYKNGKEYQYTWNGKAWVLQS